MALITSNLSRNWPYDYANITLLAHSQGNYTITNDIAIKLASDKYEMAWVPLNISLS